MIAHIDFETIGEGLKAKGATAYGEDWPTLVLCLSYQLGERGLVRSWAPPDPVPEELRVPSQCVLEFALAQSPMG